MRLRLLMCTLMLTNRHGNAAVQFDGIAADFMTDVSRNCRTFYLQHKCYLPVAGVEGFIIALPFGNDQIGMIKRLFEGL